MQFMAPDLIKTCATLLKAATRVAELNEMQHDPDGDEMTPVERAGEFPRLLIVVIKEWLRIKKAKNCELKPKQRNLPMLTLIKELVERFMEVIGVRKDPNQIKGKTSMFGFNAPNKDALDWTIADREKSELAVELLDLIRICIKDFAEPDYKQDKYTSVEIKISPLLDNWTSPPMRHY